MQRGNYRCREQFGGIIPDSFTWLRMLSNLDYFYVILTMSLSHESGI
jgi:hypothetical protein